MARIGSVLRDRLSQTTRDVIVDALIAQLLETGAYDLTYFALARRARVSVRTIYRHFPTREDLLDELSRRVNAVVALKEIPRSRESTVALVRTLFATFDEHAPLVGAQIQAGLAGKVRARARQRRVNVVEHVFVQTMPGLATERRRAAAGLISLLLSANTWARLRDETGLDGTQSGEVTAWAVDTLWRALEVEDKKAR
jgi:AcrR family transcriptional regulator